eukprot:gene14527-19504_t
MASKKKKSPVEFTENSIPLATAVLIDDSPHSHSQERYAEKNAMETSNPSTQGVSLMDTNQIQTWPSQLKDEVIRSIRSKISADKGKIFLGANSWPEGLQDALIKSCSKIAIRFFVVDDSGSMITNDGKRIVTYGPISKVVSCSRWAEISDTLLFLAQLSEALSCPSEFRLLNGADPIMIGLSDDNGESLRFLREVLQESPAGLTPICRQIDAIVKQINMIANELKANGQKAAVIITTDGECTDGSVVDALRPLRN